MKISLESTNAISKRNTKKKRRIEIGIFNMLTNQKTEILSK